MKNFGHINELPVACLICDSVGLVVACNKAFSERFNVTPVSLLNTELPGAFLPANQTAKDCISTLIEEELNEYCFLRFVACGSNQEIAVNITIMEYPQFKGYYAFYFTAPSDVQVQAFEGNFTLARMHSAIVSAGIGTWEYRVNEDKAYFSEHLKKMIGCKPAHNLAWREFRDMIYPDDLPIFDIFVSNRIEFGIPLNFEFRIKVGEKLRWFALKGAAIKSAQAHMSLMGSLVDCTREKEVLAELHNAVEAKKLAMEAGHIGTWQASREFNGEWSWNWDEVINKMFQLQPEHIGQFDRWAERIHPEDLDNVIAKLQHSLASGDLFEMKYRVQLPQDELIYIFTKGVVGRNAAGNLVRIDGVCIDLTETVKVQNELKRLNNELEARVLKRTMELESAIIKTEQASKSKSDFLAMMSHELRTPMNAIIGSLELVALERHSLETQDLIDTAKTSANNLVSILNDILDINKIEAGKMELETKPFSISDIVDNVVKIFIPVADKKDIILDVREDPCIPKLVEGDHVRVRQILFNLLGNAIKFTHTDEERVGKVVLEAKVDSASNNLIHVSFSIKDNGIGIDADTQKKLFTPFTQAERSTSRKYGGTGLGLAICGKLTDMMGGKIQLSSERGVGSTFKLTLPLWRVEQTEPSYPKLENASVAIVNINPYLVKVAKRFCTFLVEEGTGVRLINAIDDRKERLSGLDDVDLVLAMVGEVEPCRDKLSNILSMYASERTVVALERTNIELFRKAYKGWPTLAIKPVTKVQLLHSLDAILARNEEIRNQDSLEALSEDTLALDLDFDLDSSLENGAELEISQQEAVTLSPASNILENCADTQLKGDILIVEDNPFNQKLIVKQMQRLGYEANLAEDGVAGLVAWQEERPKLILTDCHMPNMDGYQMTKKIREIEKKEQLEKVPIVAITGAAMHGDEAHCRSIGMDDFISKPVQLKNLEQVISRWYPNDNIE